MKKSLAPSESKKLPTSAVGPPFDWYPRHSDPGTATTPTVQEGWSSLLQLLRGRQRIAVLTGAGISVSCGIPDFRTKDSGLYDSLDTNALGITYPEDLFDAHFFRENPVPFYQFARRVRRRIRIGTLFDVSIQWGFLLTIIFGLVVLSLGHHRQQ
jgi:Sir2 family